MTVRERLRTSPYTRFAWTPTGAAGLVMLAFVLLVALAGPLFAPHAITTTVGLPATPSGPGAALGTDFIGRDVLSRTLGGGISVLELASAATLVTYLVGVTVGMIAGYRRSIIDSVLMRVVDLLLSFPAILLLLVLVTAVGTSDLVLIVGVALVSFPGVARLVRTASLEVSVRGYVEAAVARGERAPAIMVREILPNILPSIVADFGIRFSTSIILIASLNYLGLGLRPPAADWGLMVAENRAIITANALSVLAPAVMLALLCLSVNMIGDAISGSLGRSASAARA